MKSGFIRFNNKKKMNKKNLPPRGNEDFPTGFGVVAFWLWHNFRVSFLNFRFVVCQFLHEAAFPHKFRHNGKVMWKLWTFYRTQAIFRCCCISYFLSFEIISKLHSTHIKENCSNKYYSYVVRSMTVVVCISSIFEKKNVFFLQFSLHSWWMVSIDSLFFLIYEAWNCIFVLALLSLSDTIIFMMHTHQTF